MTEPTEKMRAKNCEVIADPDDIKPGQVVIDHATRQIRLGVRMTDLCLLGYVRELGALLVGLGITEESFGDGFPFTREGKLRDGWTVIEAPTGPGGHEVQAPEPTEPAWTSEDQSTLAEKYALECARKAHPGLVDDAALSLWEEDVDAGAVKQAYLDGISVSRSQTAELAQARAFAEALRADMWRMWQGEWGPCDKSDVDEWPLPWDGDETVVQTREAFWAQYYGDPQPTAFSKLLEITKVTQLDT